MISPPQDAKDINAVRFTPAGCRPRGDKNERDKTTFCRSLDLDLADFQDSLCVSRLLFFLRTDLSYNHYQHLACNVVLYEIQLTK